MLLDDNKSKFISFKIFLIDQSPYAMTLQIKKKSFFSFLHSHDHDDNQFHFQ